MGEFSRVLASWLVIVLSIACFYPIIPSAWNLPYIVSHRYNVDIGNVVAPPRPIDCDFSTAPLGVKPCRYEATIVEESGLVYVRWVRTQFQ